MLRCGATNRGNGIGDRLRALPGRQYNEDGVEYFKGGDEGIITGSLTEQDGTEMFSIVGAKQGHPGIKYIFCIFFNTFPMLSYTMGGT